jgi:TolB-like protein/class 3 adenylate cyclase/Tfp pilus assembly protein PilF
MPEDLKTKLRLEIAHVLFMDIVGYSKLLIDEQSEALTELNQLVRNTEAAREAEAAGRLIILPTGDGMALVFTGSVEEPVECALEISQGLRAQPSLPVRMGIHSGPVHHQADVNQRENIAGAGINIAQRVMDCGDAGHILVSKRVADDLAQYRRWQPYLHELGDFEVKHGVVVSVVNLYADVVGNSEPPEKFRNRLKGASASVQRGVRIAWPTIVILLLLAIIAVGAVMFLRRPASRPTSATLSPSAPATTNQLPTAAALPSPPATIPEKSIAVLPFENLSEEKANAFFTDGVQDQILTALAKVADLKVISRTSVMQYKTGQPRNLREIAQQLGVTHVLEGSVQRAGNKVRVNAQLINAQTDAHEWAENYDRPVDDVFAIQSEIAKAIADQMQARLSPKEQSAIEQPPTADVTAFDLYSRAKSLMLTTSFSALATKSIEQAISLLEQAIARDPSFFLAYCQLSLAHDQLYFLTGADHTVTRAAKAQAALEAAFRLRPDAGEAHLTRAEFLYRIHLDYRGALAELDIARRTLPNDARIFELMGYIFRRQGDQEKGLEYVNRALTLDPRNLFTLQQVALSYFYLRRFPENVAVLERALTIKPDDPDTMIARGQVFMSWKADMQPLHQTIEELRLKNPAAISSVADSWFLCTLAERDAKAAEAALTALGDNTFGDDATQFSPDFCRGLLARMTHDENKARAAFTAARIAQEMRVKEQPDYAPALSILGIIDAALGGKEDALREGRRAVELLPVEKESNNGPGMIQNLAIIAAWVGEKQLACDQLDLTLKLPGTTSYGRLKLLPWWDPLRGDPRFEKIVASLAPK